MNIKERFKMLAELLSSYEGREGKLIEIDDQTIDYIEQEVAKIQINKLVEDIPEINPVWLITGNGSPFGDSHHSKTTQQVSGTGNVGVNFGRSSGGGTARSVVNQTNNYYSSSGETKEEINQRQQQNAEMLTLLRQIAGEANGGKNT